MAQWSSGCRQKASALVKRAERSANCVPLFRSFCCSTATKWYAIVFFYLSECGWPYTHYLMHSLRLCVYVWVFMWSRAWPTHFFVSFCRRWRWRRRRRVRNLFGNKFCGRSLFSFCSALLRVYVCVCLSVCVSCNFCIWMPRTSSRIKHTQIIIHLSIYIHALRFYERVVCCVVGLSSLRFSWRKTLTSWPCRRFMIISSPKMLHSTTRTCR